MVKSTADVGYAAERQHLHESGFGQATFVAGSLLPTGFVFEGVRFFESTNMPFQTQTQLLPVQPLITTLQSVCSSVLSLLASASAATTLRFS